MKRLIPRLGARGRTVRHQHTATGQDPKGLRDAQYPSECGYPCTAKLRKAKASI